MAPQVMPDPLDRVELWAVGRQRDQGDIVGDLQFVAAMPTSAIDDERNMNILVDLATDLSQMLLHRPAIAHRHDDRRRLFLQRADRAEDVGRGIPLILWCHRAGASWRPQPGQWVFLADARFILEPDFDFLPRACSSATCRSCDLRVVEMRPALPHRPLGGGDAAPANSSGVDAAADTPSSD